MTAPRLGIDAEGLKALAKDLKAAKNGSGKLLQQALKRGAEIVAVEARGRSSWSSRIPSSIKARATAAGKAYVIAGGPRAPHATFWEATTKGGHRHPVFARGSRSRWTWTDKPAARPFMVPALGAKADEVAEAFADGLVAVFGSARFR